MAAKQQAKNQNQYTKDREERVAAALRENLRKRKEQQLAKKPNTKD